MLVQSWSVNGTINATCKLEAILDCKADLLESPNFPHFHSGFVRMTQHSWGPKLTHNYEFYRKFLEILRRAIENLQKKGGAEAPPATIDRAMRLVGAGSKGLHEGRRSALVVLSREGVG